MKLFWSIIAIFVLAAAGMVWSQMRDPSGPGVARDTAIAARPAQADDPLIASTPQRPDSRSGPAREPQPSRIDADVAAPDDRREAQPSTDDPDARAVEKSDTSTGSADDPAQELIDDLLTGETAPFADFDGPGPGHEHQQIQESENPWAADAAPADRTPIEHSVKRQEDGSTLLDGLFTVRGNGTAESPYEITWDLLMSAAETYQPRLGLSELPERIKMLDGAHVKLAGFLMFPLASFEAKEALVMLNMWDGCCLGTMPSPYDAVEVQFTKGVPASTRQFANYGTIRGRLVVDPYLIDDWLIGLYLIEDAELDVGM